MAIFKRENAKHNHNTKSSKKRIISFIHNSIGRTQTNIPITVCKQSKDKKLIN